MVFSALSFLVAIPSAIKVFNWTATLYKGSISWETPMLYAFGFIGLFTIGGLTGLFLAALGLDVHVHDTYFIVAHFHYIMVGGAIMGYLGGLHFWWPKITGRLYPEWWARVAAVIVFVGFNLTFFPQFILGYLGMPRRYHVYPAGVPGAERDVLRGRLDPGRGLPAAAGLPRLVDALRPLRGPEPLGGHRPRVADRVAAPHRELRRRRRWCTRRPTTTPAASRERSMSETVVSGHAAHGPLVHHFADLEQQKEAATLGMWVFLVTEIMFFGGFFCAYAIYRNLYYDAFAAGSHHLSWRLGTFNTAVLIGSSLTMALAVHAAAVGKTQGDRRLDRPHHPPRRRPSSA